ncbi:glycosyltransferase family 4 protein [Sphingomonas sp. UYAg733]
MPLVCIDCRYIRAPPSGIGEVVQALVDHAPALAPDLRFLLLKHPEAPAILSGAANVTERAVTFAANGPATMWMMSRLTDLSEVDLFHAPANILPHGLTMPTVTTVHDVMWLKHPDWAAKPGLRGRIDRAFYRHGIRHALDRSTRIATVSQATRDEIATIDPVAAERTFVTLSGVAPDFRRLAAQDGGAAALPALAGRRYILTVGQYAPYKNHLAALEAFAMAFGDDPDIALVFVQRQGDGAAALLPRAATLGVADRVLFVPHLDREHLIALYNGALALCHPSLYEGFGNPIAEAMACGCPVVTSNVSAMPEVAGGAALLIDPSQVTSIAAALHRVASEPGLGDVLRQRGLDRAVSLPWIRFAQANVTLYREVLAGQRERKADKTAPAPPRLFPQRAASAA